MKKALLATTANPATWLRLGISACVFALATGAALAEVAQWDEPGLDRWFHQGNSAPGLKSDLSTFTNYGVSSGFSQSRAGTFLVGFDTSDQIELVSPQRYQINSIRITLDYVDDDRSVAYDPTADSLAAITGGTDDPGKPIELFGIGYGNDYTQLGFGANDAQPPEFEESSPLWPNVPDLEKTYNIFPLGDDGTGNLGNVFNSPGGEGEFELDENNNPVLVEVTRDPWETTPWAIGTAAGLSSGETIPGGTQFVFDVNLALPGVLEYFQQSLSIGQLGVFIASLHDVSNIHEGGADEGYPAFYSKESLFVSAGVSSAPTLAIDYAILPDLTPGDFDTDGDVDTEDLQMWRDHFGGSGGADANGDGITNGTDFLVWQRNFTGPLSSAAHAVPEPRSWSILTLGCLALGCLLCRTTK